MKRVRTVYENRKFVFIIDGINDYIVCVFFYLKIYYDLKVKKKEESVIYKKLSVFHITNIYLKLSISLNSDSAVPLI